MSQKVKLERAVKNPALELFKINDGQDKILLKVFQRSHIKDLSREVKQYNYFNGLQFIPERLSYSLNSTLTISYKWIEGYNGYDFLRRAEAQKAEKRENLFKKVVKQMVGLGNCIPENLYLELHKSGTKFSLQNPLHPKVLDYEKEKEFSEAYKSIHNFLLETCRLFPGVYTDRNPGNFIIAAKSKKLYQLDFGLVEATTPIFDLTKLLRTLTCEPSVRRLDNVEIKSDNSLSVENRVLEYAYKTFTGKSRYKWLGKMDELNLHFLYAALREHIFYITKAEFLLMEGKVNSSIQEIRKRYHIKMLNKTYDRLIALNQPVSEFGRWVNVFTQIDNKG